MQVIQRGLMIILGVLLLLGGVALVEEHKEDLMKQWEEMQTERFLSRIATTGVCTYEDMVLYQDALKYSCADAEIRLEEYQKEMALSGEEYWYLITWEEILETLVKDGKYGFHHGSALELCIRDYAETERKYCEVVTGKE